MSQLAAACPDLGQRTDSGTAPSSTPSPTTHRLRRALTVALVALVGAAVSLTLMPPTAQAAPAIPTSAKRHPTLQYNSQGSAVKYLQKRLKVRPTSGWFGPVTRRHVRAYQRSHDLAVTGKVTWRMWRKLGVPYVAPSRKTPTSGKPGSKKWSDRVVAIARAQKGDPYRYGAAGPNAFDCSGLTMYVMKRMGVKLTHSASEQRRSSKVRAISKSDRKPGDLVFVRSGSGASHAAIYAGGGKWWEAAKPGTSVMVRTIWTSNVAYARIRG